MAQNKQKIKTTEVITIKRSEIQKADYNPRTISDEAKRKLKKNLKEFGLVEPLIWNQRSGNLVGGHQRITIMDEIHKGEDYDLPVSVVDLDERAEAVLNVRLNNPSSQGEWDSDILVELKDYFPDLDFEKELFFEKYDMDYLFAGYDDFENVSEIFQETEEQKTAVADIEKIKEAKKEHREKAKAENENGTSHNPDKADYTVTVVFNNNAEKFAFMESIKKPRKERFIKASVLYDIYQGKYQIA